MERSFAHAVSTAHFCPCATGGPRRGHRARHRALRHGEPPAPPESAPRNGYETGDRPHLPAGHLLSPCGARGRHHPGAFGCGGTRRRVAGEMGNLTPKNHEAWSRGHVPYLERVFAGSLSKANRILRLIGFHVHDLDMAPRRTVYYQGGQSTNRRLRFSKSGQAGIEEAYATHY